jgi:hypothetical protein
MAMADGGKCHDMLGMCAWQMPHGPSLWENIMTQKQGVAMTPQKDSAAHNTPMVEHI